MARRSKTPGVTQRPQLRVNRIVESILRLETKIVDNPDHPKADIWRERILEYKQSLITFATYGQETPPGAARAVSIDVPLGRFGLKKD